MAACQDPRCQAPAARSPWKPYPATHKRADGLVVCGFHIGSEGAVKLSRTPSTRTSVSDQIRSPKAEHARHRYEDRLPGDEFTNCPVLERTGDGHPVGRCWFHLPDGKTCPRHGDIFLFKAKEN